MQRACKRSVSLRDGILVVILSTPTFDTTTATRIDSDDRDVLS